MGLVEIFDDGERFEQHRAVVLDQCWQCHHRIDLAEGILALLALHEIDVDHLVWHNALEVERDANSERRQRAPERKQFHGSSSRGNCEGILPTILYRSQENLATTCVATGERT